MRSRFLIGAMALAACVAAPRPAAADITVFLGTSPTPVSRPLTGGSIGVGLIVVGFEFEYANTSEDTANGAPAVKTGMANFLVQTPTHGFQIYGTVGAGIFHESLSGTADTNVGTNIGGGVKISLIGPIRIRLDYRVFNFHGSPLYGTPKRFYAGLNLSF